MKRLIVNADDFGLTAGVNRAIVELRAEGLLTSATLMANAAATDEAVSLALANAGLGVGCHVVLVDGEPITPVESLPTLTGAKDLSRTLGQFVSRIHLAGSKAIAADIEREAFAQMSRLRDRGVALTHVDTHKHTHMFPRVLRPLLRAARAAGVRAVRNPFEPAWAREATSGAPLLRRTQVRLLHMLHWAFRRVVAEEGLVTTDGTIGVLATGTLDERTVDSLLGAMPDGVWELVTHPGYSDADLARAKTRLLASREIEMQALARLREARGVELIHFGGLGE
jgi:predicted glycoside hydrolase/deacetylase ChbG (UPF0249 family)